VKVGDLVKHSLFKEGGTDLYGVGIVFSFSPSGEFVQVFWTRANVAWSFIKYLEVINEA
jgi:hypothetical protein